MPILRVFWGLCLLLLWGGAAWAAPTVSAVRVGATAERTRFVIEMTEKADYQVMTLANPYRMVIDFEHLQWAVKDRNIEPGGLIGNIRYGRFTANTSRVVLDLTGPADVAQVFILPPQGSYPTRFVVDLKPTTKTRFMAGINQPDRDPSFRLRTAPPAMTAPPRVKGKRIVVVDAGHGGIDPGTLGSSGPDEKHVTLAVAKELARQLEATGRYTVVLTRDKDIFLPLRGRIDVARHANADLFISLHCDSISNSKVRGSTVYTLSETSSDKEAAALAAKENRSDIIAGVNLDGESDDVSSILIDLAQRETMNYSAEFAELLVPSLGKSVIMRTNSHRFAGFVVLKAPDVPSVLIEMGFLSNPKDARFMYSRDGQSNIAAGIVRATDKFFARLEG
jgi:N-acetylmuramoyl-L-alanine amidase